MKYERIIEKAKKYRELVSSLDSLVVQNWETAFEVEYTHDSTAIEGNTLSLMETKVVLEDGISVGGKHLREIYEVINHRKAYRYIKEKIAAGYELDESIVKDKFGETSAVQDDVPPNGEAITELVAPRISVVDDAKLFYKAVGGSKKGQVYGNTKLCLSMEVCILAKNFLVSNEFWSLS